MWNTLSYCCHLAAVFFVIVLTGRFGLAIGAEGQKGVGVWKGVCELLGDEVPQDVGSRRRSKRSLKGAEQENPEALFKYLFPLVVEEEKEAEQEGTQGRRGRHMDFDSDLTAWIQDALALVRQECEESLNPSRRPKNYKKKAGRSVIRRQGNWRDEGFVVNKSANPQQLTPWNLPEGYNIRWGSDAVGRSAANGTSSGGHEEEDDETEAQVEDEDSELLDELANFEDDDEDYEENFETSTGAVDTTEAPSATTPTDTTTPFNPGDVHFASYGGDVEYWFPMISWGIPFDGEITVYNFHGFDGMGTF